MVRTMTVPRQSRGEGQLELFSFFRATCFDSKWSFRQETGFTEVQAPLLTFPCWAIFLFTISSGQVVLLLFTLNSGHIVLLLFTLSSGHIVFLLFTLSSGHIVL